MQVSTDNEISVLVVDDSAMVRDAVRHSLRGIYGCTIVGEGVNGVEALELARIHRPNLVVMDIQMPILDGLGALGTLRKELPSTHVVMMSTVVEPEIRTKALNLGALACLEKGRDLLGGLPQIVERLYAEKSDGPVGQVRRS